MVGYGEITLKWVLESYGSRNTWMMDNFQNDYKKSLFVLLLGQSWKTNKANNP